MESLLIWDLENELNFKTDSKIFLWNSFASNSKEYISVPKYIDDNAEILRLKYLNWIYDISQNSINNNTLIANLKIRKNV